MVGLIHSIDVHDSEGRLLYKRAAFAWITLYRYTFATISPFHLTTATYKANFKPRKVVQYEVILII